ncbi:MAG TPA: MarR family transcriptional regulator [Candidatus Gastranaerophilales bacterium]|nr:MarR family transcriptional regulator [Candidatus Gastranaerophilales bacterium]
MQNKFKVEENIDYIISKTVQVIKNSLYKNFKENGYNITPEQWSLLVKLYDEDGIYQKQLGDYLFKDKPTITRILDIIEDKNFIIRIPDDKDRRKTKVYLTQDGKNLVKDLIPVANDFQEKLTKDISASEIENFTRILEKLDENVCK